MIPKPFTWSHFANRCRGDSRRLTQNSDSIFEWAFGAAGNRRGTDKTLENGNFEETAVIKIEF